MKELNKKVFKTIFLLLTLFLITGILIYNITSYKKEYDNVKRNLTMMQERNRSKPPELKEPKETLEQKNQENMMIMDYEVYTVTINNNEIEKITSHSSNTSGFNIKKIAKSIINKKQGLNINNLYFNNYSYNNIDNTIIIINNEKINKRLINILIESLIVFIIFESIIIIVSKSITNRITKPAEDAFNKQKDFIADASHELKTPLAVIIASSDELKSDNKNKKYIDNIKYESERMNTLIKSLLDLSKLENKVSVSNYKDENISKIIERITLTFDSIAFENNIGINTNIEKDIIFKCSKDEIERLISIILDNAIKHSYKDTTIKVLLNKNKNNINIEITNTGDPIKPGDEEKIFERFYRGDKSRKRDTNRYGLGLAIAKNIVNNHNGVIKAYSIDNETTFKINFKK